MRISPPCCDISSGSNNAFWRCKTSVRRSGADDRAPPEPPILRSSTINLEKVQPPASEAVSAFPDTIVCGPRPLKSCWQESIQRLTAPPNFRITNTRSEEHTSELQSLMHTSYAVLCLKKTKTQTKPK